MEAKKDLAISTSVFFGSIKRNLQTDEMIGQSNSPLHNENDILL